MVVPKEEPNHSAPYLLNFCDGEGNQLLAVGQWKSGLIVRSASPGQYLPKAYSETGAYNVLLKKRAEYVVIVSREGDAVIYSGGKFAKERRGFPLFRRGDVSPRLIVVGNSSTGKNPWEGDFLYLAIHDRALSMEEIAERYSRLKDQGIPRGDYGAAALMEYNFEDRDGNIARNWAGERFPLLIPRSFRPIKMILLELPNPKKVLTRSNITDVLINMVGFIPFGILVTVLRKTNLGDKSALRMTFLLILAGGVFSLCIEILQGFLPYRSSSMLDVIMNVFGTLIGGVLVFCFSRKEGRSLKRSSW